MMPHQSRLSLGCRPRRALQVLLTLTMLFVGIWLFYQTIRARATLTPSGQARVEQSPTLPSIPPAVVSGKTEQGRTKIPDSLKPRTPPTAEEIERFLEKAVEKDSVYAWAYAQTKDTRWLKEGLRVFPADRKLNYLAALLSQETAQEDPDLATLKNNSSKFLSEQFPGIAAFLLANTQRNSTQLDTIHQFYDGRQELKQIDAAFRYTDQEFLTSIREYSPLGSKRESMYPRNVGIAPKLHELACSANPHLADVARLVLAGSDLVKSALVGTELQQDLVTTLPESTVQARFGSSKIEYQESIRNDFTELNTLKQMHEKLYEAGNERALLRFQELRREVGEREALRSMRIETTEDSKAE